MAAGDMARVAHQPEVDDQVNWSYGWTPATPGSVTIKSRAVDDSGNLETPLREPLSRWRGARRRSGRAAQCPGLVDQGPDSPVELGVKFYSEVGGAIKGIRFYKSSANTGTHVGQPVVERWPRYWRRDVYE